MFGVAIVEGVALKFVMVGGVVSGVTSTEPVERLVLPEKSVHCTVSVYVRPPTAFTLPVESPVTCASAAGEMLESLHDVTPESSVAAMATLTGTICPFGGQMGDGVTVTPVMTGAVESVWTTTFAVAVLEFPAASLHVTVNV